MGIQCRIIRNPQTGKIENVEAPNGEQSQLYLDTLAMTQNEEEALDLWATSYIDEFKEIYGNSENPLRLQDSVRFQQGGELKTERRRVLESKGQTFKTEHIKGTLTRVQTIEGLKVDDKGNIVKTLEEYQQNENTVRRNTIHFSSQAMEKVGGFNDWSHTTVAFIAEHSDIVKENGDSIGTDPTDTFFYNEDYFVIPKSTKVITIDKNAYDLFKKQGYNVDLLEGNFKDMVESVNNYKPENRLSEDSMKTIANITENLDAGNSYGDNSVTHFNTMLATFEKKFSEESELTENNKSMDSILRDFLVILHKIGDKKNITWEDVSKKAKEIIEESKKDGSGINYDLYNFSRLNAYALRNEFKKYFETIPSYKTQLESIKTKKPEWYNTIQNLIKDRDVKNQQQIGAQDSVRFQQGAQKVKEYKKLLDKAKELEKNNVSLSDITDQTGWFKYKGSWRFFSNEALEQFKINENAIEQGTEQKLSDILSTDNILFDMYPTLGAVKIIVSQDSNLPKNASYNEGGKIIKTNLFKGRELQAAIAHEVAHFIQQREGLPQGGNHELLLQQLVGELNFIPKNTPLTLNQLKDLLNKNRTADNKSTVDAVLSLVDNNTDEAKYKVYRAIMGEMDAHMVTKAYTNRETPYTYLELLDEELIEQRIADTDVITINSQGDVSFTPKPNNNTTEATQQIIDQLQKTGLAENVYQLSSQEIENKLEELGVSEELRKQVIAYHGTVRKFSDFLRVTPEEGRYGQVLSGTYFGEGFVAFSFAGGTPFTSPSGRVLKASIDDSSFYTVDMKDSTPSSDQSLINTIGEQEFDKILDLKNKGKIKGLRLENTREFLAGETKPTTQYVVYDNQLVEVLKEYRQEQADVFQPRFQVPTTPTWISNAKEGIAKIKQGKATPEQWVKQVADKGGKGTTQELEWIGLQDFLDSYVIENNTKSVPKEVVEQYINDNQIEIVEVGKGERKLSIGKEGSFFIVIDENGNKLGNTSYATEDMAQEVIDDKRFQPSKYSQYQLEGGENYREVLLTLPNRETLSFEEWVEQEYGDALDLTENQLRLAKSQYENAKQDLRRGTEKGYKSSHWDEANILAHLRLNERTLSNGERVLFIEEVQSDWAQEGKKKGFKGDNKRIKELSDILKKDPKNTEAYDEFQQLQGGLRESTPNMPYKKTDQWVGMAMRRAMQMAAQEGFDRVAWVTGEQSAERYSLREHVNSITVNPNDNGKFVFIDMKSNYNVTLNVDNSGKIIEDENNLSGDQSFVGKQLEDVVGKDMAEKILKETSENKYEGDGLEVGGEGMKTFYNSIVPKVIKKEAQRFDKKAKVDVVDFNDTNNYVTFETIEIEGDNFIKLMVDGKFQEGVFDYELEQQGLEPNESGAREYLQEYIPQLINAQGAGKQLSLKITPKMKESLSQGVPLFQKQLEKNGIKVVPNGFTINNEVYLNKDTMNETTPIHEFSHLYNSWLKQNRPEVYKKGLDLVKAELGKTDSGIQDVIDYVKTTQPNLEGEALNEEILTELVGRKGLEKITDQKQSGIIEWLKEAWQAIKDMLGISQMTTEQILNLDLQSYADAMAVDLLSGENFIGEQGDQTSKAVLDRLENLSMEMLGGVESLKKRYKSNKKVVPLQNNLKTEENDKNTTRGVQETPEQARRRRERWDESRGNQTLEGAPKYKNSTGAIPELVSLAEEYAEKNNIPYKRQKEYVEVDPERAVRIAKAYEDMEHKPQDPVVKEAYENLISQTTAQYKVLVEAGYQFYFFDETNDPYDGKPVRAMVELRSKRTMGSFATEAGFGSNVTDLDVSDNPMLRDTGFEWGFGSVDGKKKRVLANDLFRAVHDAFGHGLEGAGFRARGEENAWQAHARLFTGSAVAAITSETRGQNSWLNFGMYGEQNKTASVEDTIFADQKVGLMPEWTWIEGFDEGVSNTKDKILISEVYNPRENESFEQYKSRMIEEASAILLQNNSTEYFEKIAEGSNVTFGKSADIRYQTKPSPFTDENGEAKIENVLEFLKEQNAMVNTTTVFRGEGNNFAEGINTAFTWVALSRQTASNYGDVTEMELTLPQNPFKPPYKSNVDVRAENIANLLRQDVYGKIKNNEIDVMKASMLMDEIKSYENLAENTLEKYHTKISKPKASNKIKDILEALGYDGIFIPEGDGTYAIFKESVPQTKNLTAQEKITVANILRTKQISSQELSSELNRIFADSKFNKEVLNNSSIFSRAEAIAIQQSEEYIKNLKELSEKEIDVKDTVDYPKEFLVSDGAINKYGLYNTQNPLTVEETVKEQVADTENYEEFANKFNQLDYPDLVNKFNEDSEFAFMMYSKYAHLKKMPSLGNDLQPNQTPNKVIEVENSLDISKMNTSDINYLLDVSSEVWNESESQIVKGLNEVSKKAEVAGLDLSDLSDAYYTKTQEEIENFLKSITTLKEDVTEETLNTFLESYRDFFNIEAQDAQVIEEVSINHRDKALEKIDDRGLSEYTLFEKEGLLKVAEQTYQRVEKVSLENLYEMVYAEAVTNDNRVMPNTAYFNSPRPNNQKLQDPQSKEEILNNMRIFIENNVSLLNLDTDTYDSSVAQQMLLYKYFFEAPITIETTTQVEDAIQEIENFDGDSFYLSSAFHTDFQANKLREKRRNSVDYQNFYKHFTVNQNGLKLIEDNRITIQQLKENVPENIREDFKNYGAVSRNTSIKRIVKDTENKPYFNSLAAQRNFYQNNVEALTPFKGDYQNIGEGRIATTEYSQSFLRIGNKLYEKSNAKSGTSFYGQILINNSNFNLIQEQGIINNFGEQDIKSYIRNQENIERNSNFYTKEELEEINQKHFNCGL